MNQNHTLLGGFVVALLALVAAFLLGYASCWVVMRNRENNHVQRAREHEKRANALMERVRFHQAEAERAQAEEERLLRLYLSLVNKQDSITARYAHLTPRIHSATRGELRHILDSLVSDFEVNRERHYMLLRGKAEGGGRGLRPWQ